MTFDDILTAVRARAEQKAIVEIKRRQESMILNSPVGAFPRSIWPKFSNEDIRAIKDDYIAAAEQRLRDFFVAISDTKADSCTF